MSRSRRTDFLAIGIMVLLVALIAAIGLGGEYARAWLWGKAMGFKPCTCHKQKP